MQSRTRNLPLVLLGLALAASAALLLWLSRDFTFFQDTWAFLMHRQDNSLDSFLVPHNEHIVFFSVAIEKLLVDVFGMTSALPERVTMVLLLALVGALLFVYVRRRLGPWPALMAALLLLFLGSAWPVLLWPFEDLFVGSVACGIGMLLALERDDARGDAVACLLLIFCFGFSTLGVCFALAAAVDVAIKRRRRGLARAYLFVVPGLLFLAWYAGWGHDAESHLSLANMLRSPPYVLEGFASALGAISGLSTTTTNLTESHPPEWGRLLLVVAIGLVVWGQRRRPGFSPQLWPVLAAALSYWLLAGFNFIPGREAASSRYIYVGVVLLLLVAVELLRGVHFGRRALWAGAALTVLAIAPNLVQLRTGRDWLAEQTVITRSDLAAMEIARDTIAPEFALSPEVAGTGSLIDVNAESYFEATEAHGSPAYSEAELVAATPTGRYWADVVLARALPIALETRPGFRLGETAACLPVWKRRSPTIPIGDGGPTRIAIAPGPPAEIFLRRFADPGQYPVVVGNVPGNSIALLRVPADRSPRPWKLHVEAGQRAWVCG
ncbi:MAG TPA: hypothetical protein VGO66_01375 [Solirubrobacterales bacterium]|jgi:hypothetical protein|nr:hypothetical protein [Solirubrobacterales bacterium]